MDAATAVMGTIYSFKTFSTHQQAESDILKVLIPSTFLNDNVSQHMQIFDHAKLDENGLIDYSNSFSSGHLQFICSANFRVRGILSKSSEQHPIGLNYKHICLRQEMPNLLPIIFSKLVVFIV
jgi:hypothetical protein